MPKAGPGSGDGWGWT